MSLGWGTTIPLSSNTQRGWGIGYSDLTFADFVPAPFGDGYVACGPYPATLKLPMLQSCMSIFISRKSKWSLLVQRMYLDIFATGLQDREV